NLRPVREGGRRREPPRQREEAKPVATYPPLPAVPDASRAAAAKDDAAPAPTSSPPCNGCNPNAPGKAATAPPAWRTTTATTGPTPTAPPPTASTPSATTTTTRPRLGPGRRQRQTPHGPPRPPRPPQKQEQTAAAAGPMNDGPLIRLGSAE